MGSIGKSSLYVSYDSDKIDTDSVGTKYITYGGLTKQSAYPDYHRSIYARPLNTKLRSGEQLTSKESKIVAVMDSLMETTISPIRVDSEVSISYLKSVGLDIQSIGELPKLVGKTFTDKGYRSSSYSKHKSGRSNYGFGATPVQLIIQVPTGTPAYLTDNNAEHEITLGRGLSYKILKYTNPTGNTNDNTLVIKII